MDEFLNKVLVAAQNRWHKPIGLICALIFSTLISLTFILTYELWKISPYVWMVIPCEVLLLYLYWLHTHIPKAHRKKFGVGVAITYENTDEGSKLHSDFVEELRTGLKGSGQLAEIDFLSYSQSISASVNDEETARKLMQNGRLQFLLWGKIRNRPFGSNDKSKNIIDLQGMVAHEPLSDGARKSLKKEFCETLPKRLILDPNLNLLGCEITGHLVHAAAKYTIGVMLSYLGYLEYAEKVLLDVVNTASARIAKSSIPPAQEILKRARNHLGMIYDEQIRLLLDDFRRTKDASVLQEVERIISKRKIQIENNYAVSLASAMCTFVLTRDVAAARDEILKYKNPADNVWLFNLAFLSAYEGDLNGAYKNYNAALRIAGKDPSIPLQCEEFMQDILDEEPDKTQLYYCLGIINYKFKRDFRTALRDFQKFIQYADARKYPVQFSSVQRWVTEIVNRKRARAVEA